MATRLGLHGGPRQARAGVTRISGSTSLTFTPTGNLSDGAGNFIRGSTTLTFATSGDIVGRARISGATSLAFDVTGNAIGRQTVSIAGSTSLAFNITGALADANFVPVKSGSGAPTKYGKRLYVVEVDGVDFIAHSVQEALQLLSMAEELAEEAVEKAPTVAAKPASIKIRTRGGAKSKSKQIQKALTKARSTIKRAHTQAKQRLETSRKLDAEISRLIQSKLHRERDEEEAIIALLML